MEDLVGIVIWFVGSLLVSTVAGNRGRGSGRWFLFSLLASPLIAGAFLCGAYLTSLKKCPMCAEMVQDSALICKHCHSRFSEDSVKAAMRGYNG
jgi:hypothetical protein